MDEKQKIENIIKACDEMIAGKFILADTKITKILRLITESEQVYALLSNSIANFNFDREFARARVRKSNKNGYFVLPNDEHKILAMVFCLLVQIENRTLEFADFLSNYFKAEGLDEYECFTNQIIEPFRNIIAAHFAEEKTNAEIVNNENQAKWQGGEKQMKNNPESSELDIPCVEEEFRSEMEEIDREEITSKHFRNIISVCEEIISQLTHSKVKKTVKEDLIIISDSIILACEIQNLRILNGLMVGFNKIAKNVRCIRFIYRELQQTMVEFYEYLQS